MSYRSKKEKQFADQLTSAGLVFETNANDLPGTPDIVFREERLVVFFHGCFWHGHHCLPPSKNHEWKEKIAATKEKDKKILDELYVQYFSARIIWEVCLIHI